MLGASAFAQLATTFSKVGPEYRLTLQPNPALYFGFQHTPDILIPFNYEAMSLGTPGPIVFGYTPGSGEPRGFFRARGISVSAPEDADGDLIDDLWELQNGLNPLFAQDAIQLSSAADRLPGETNLAYYRRKRGISNLTELVSRSVSLFNFGQPSSATEGISRAISVYNGAFLPSSAIPEVYSREASVFNFGSPLAVNEKVSREVAVFNFGSPLTGTEAMSRGVSVFNGDTLPVGGFPQVHSRETSLFNFGGASSPIEAISRAISVNRTQ